MEVAKLSAPPNLQVRSVSCNESAIKRWLSSELEETVFSLTHELFMTQHYTGEGGPFFFVGMLKTFFCFIVFLYMSAGCVSTIRT